MCLFCFIVNERDSNWILHYYPRFYVVFMFYPTLMHLSFCHEPVTLFSAANSRTKTCENWGLVRDLSKAVTFGAHSLSCMNIAGGIISG